MSDGPTDRITRALGMLVSRRARIDADELALIEESRTLGWSWADLAAAYGCSAEGARQRHRILTAKQDKGLLPAATSPDDALRAVLAKHAAKVVEELVEMGVYAAQVVYGDALELDEITDANDREKT